MFYVGLDIHSKSIVICVLDNDGKVCGRATVRQLDELMAKLQRFMGHADPRTTQRYYDHLEVDDLETALDLVPELAPTASRPLALSPGR